jgi:hypothetical protein
MALALRSVSEAADVQRWTAGERATVSSPADAAVAQRLGPRLTALERPLGLAGAAGRRIAIVEDRFHARTVDEATYLDGRGHPVAIVRLDGHGALVSAVRLGYRDALATGTLTGVQAEARARSLIAALDLAVPAREPLVRLTMNGALWTVSWARTVDGTIVEGDGLTVRLWRSGDLHSVTVSERPIANPSSMLTAEEARAALEAALPHLVTTDGRAEATLSALGLRWVAANDRYRPEGADAPAPVLRLAYTFELRFGGANADVIRAATFWIDAETGELIGGDVLR